MLQTLCRVTGQPQTTPPHPQEPTCSRGVSGVVTDSVSAEENMKNDQAHTHRPHL